MDTLSTSATATAAAAHFKHPASLHQVKATSGLLPPAHHNYHLSSTPKTTTSRRSLTNSASSPFFLSGLKSAAAARTSLKQSPVLVHRRAVSGYAAALVEAVQSGGSAAFAAVTKDVRRFSKLLRRKEIRDFMEDESTGEKEKGEVLKTIAERKKFDGQLKVLLNLVIEKGRLGLFGEILDEFEKIYEELQLQMGRKEIVMA